MSLAELVTNGRTAGRPRKQMIAGEPGIGKSTLAAAYPKPIFIRTEDGDVDAAALPLITHWNELRSQLKLLMEEKHDYKTLVIDAVDGLERLIFEEVCRENQKNSIEDFGYSKGYVKAIPYWENISRAFNYMVRKLNMNVVMISHTHIKAFTAPDSEAFDRYEPRMNKHGVSFLTEYCDEVLMCVHDRKVRVGDNGKGKVKASSRVIITNPDSGFALAKNRLDLPEEIAFDKDNLEGIVKMLLNK